jgi:hypothetical protein
MKLTYLDVANAMEWAIQNAGEDNPAEVMAYKMLELIAKSHESNAAYHERQVDACRNLMSEIDARFKVSGDAEF